MDLGEYNYQEKNNHEIEGEVMLTWRMDPRDSWSDWTIVVETKCQENGLSIYSEHNYTGNGSLGENLHAENHGEREHEYHVHKAQLSVGKRKSEYFSRLFQNDMAESSESKSRITLEKSAATAFPIFLDFIYSNVSDDIPATSENAVALRFLSQYFGVRELFENINKLIRSDLTFSNAHLYLCEGYIYHDEKVVSHSKRLCAENFQVIGGKLAAKLPAKLFKEVILSPYLKCESKALSLCVAHLCETQPDAIDAEMLSALTDFRIMPNVDSSIAIFLLRLSISKNMDSYNISGDKWSLKKRCISAASVGWKDAMHEVLNDLPSNIRIELMAASLREAKKELIEEKLKSQENHRKVKRAIEERDASLMDALTNIFQSRNEVGEKKRVLTLVRSKMAMIEGLVLHANIENAVDMSVAQQVIAEVKNLIDIHLSNENLDGSPNIPVESEDEVESNSFI